MIKIDKKTLVEFQQAGVKKIHVFFYEAGCSGTKVDIETDFDEKDLELVAIFPELDENGKPLPNLPLSGDEQNSSLPGQGEMSDRTEGFSYENGIKVYIKPENKQQFDGAMITKIREKSDNPHLQGKKEKYIFSNPKIQDRCGCGTSFSFEKKVPKIDIEKLRFLKDRFKK